MNAHKLCHKTHAPITAALALMACLIPEGAPRAATIYWTNSTTGNWTNTANWSSNAVPAATDAAFIDNAGTAQLDTTATINWLHLANQSGTTGALEVLPGATLNVSAAPSAMFLNVGRLGIGELRQTGGTINFGSPAASQVSMSVGEMPGSYGVYTLSGGYLNVYSQSNSGVPPGFNVGRDATGIWNVWGGKAELRSLYIGKTGSAVGTVNQTNGIVNVGVAIAQVGETRIGGATSANTNAVGTYNISVGTYTNALNYQVGAYGRGTNNISGTAVVTINGWPSIGRFSGSVGELDVNGGTFNQLASGYRLIVGEQGTGYLNVRSNGVANLMGLYLGYTATGNGTVNLDGGAINTGFVRGNGGTGIFNFNGGTLQFTASTLINLTGLAAVNLKPGGAVLDTGTNTVTLGANLLDAGGGLTKLGSGLLTLNGTNNYSGNTVVSAGWLKPGNANAIPSGPGKGILQVDGTANFDLSGFDLTVNALAGTGTVRTTNGVRGLFVGGTDQSSTFNGVLLGTGSANRPVVVKNGTGMLELAGTNDNSWAAAIVNSGTLLLGKTVNAAAHAVGWYGSPAALSIGAASTVRISGSNGDQIWDGSDVAIYGGAFDLNGRSETIRTLLGASGVVSNGAAATLSTLTIGAANGSGSYFGTIRDGAGAVGLIKIGTGAALLFGTNICSGGTIISNGTLFINGSLAGGVEVSAGTLGGAGLIIGPVTNRAAIAPGDLTPLGAGTLTVGSLTCASNATLNFQLAGVTNIGSGINDLLVVNGDLVLSKNLVVVTPLDSTLAPGTYGLVNYTGAKSGSLGGVLHSTRYLLTLDESTPGQINLVVSSGSGTDLRWTGVSNAVWDVGITTNWVNTATTAPEVFLQLDRVLFDDTPGSLPNVTLASNVYPGGITVNASGNNFVLSGSGRISGGGGITKLGTSTLTISNANDFTGPVVVRGGTLKTGNAAALGSTAGATIVTNGGALDVNARNLGAEPVIAAGSGPGGGGAIINTGADQYPALRFVTLLGDTTVGGSGRWDLRTDDPLGTPAALNGNGYRLTKTGANTVGLVGLGETGLGDIVVNQGQLTFQSTTTMGDPTRSITLAPGTTLSLWDLITPVSKLAFLTNATVMAYWGANNIFLGPIALTGGNSIPVYATLDLRGPISGSGSLNKSWTGTMVLSGTNNFDGGLTISEGMVQLGNGGVGGDAGNGPITNNATLQFNRSDLQLLSNPINGTGVVSQLGNGTTVFPVANTYSGETRIYTGALRVTHSGALGTLGGRTRVFGDIYGTGRLELAGGITLDEPVTVDCRKDAFLDAPEIVNVSGSNTLNGLISGFIGGYHWNVQSDAGRLLLLGNFTNTTSSLVRALKLLGAGDGEWRGAIGNSSGNASLTAVAKMGTGTWILSGANTYTGGTTNLDGTLLVNGTLANAPVVMAGGTLGGLGLISGPVTIQTNGTLAPGASLGALTVSNSVTLAGNTVMELIRQPGLLTNDLLRGVSLLTLGGTLMVLTTNSSADFTDGDTVKLFDATSYAGGFTNFVLPDLGPCLTWDRTGLAVDGTLKLVGAASRPVITQQPASRATLLGKTVTFQVTATSSSSINYQWFFNGSALASQTNRTLSLTNVQGADLGTYSVLLSASGCSTLSESAWLSAAVSPSLSAPQFIDPVMILSFKTEVGPSYVVEYSDSLRPPDWKILATRAGTGFTISLADAAPALQSRFYRIRLQ